MKLGIYGTIYNNVDTVETTIRTLTDTIKDLFDEIIFVITDNHSDDGSYEKLLELKKEYENFKIKIDVIREKCTRGKGRQIAMEYLINNYDVDFITYTDFDVTYLPFQRNIFEAIINHIKDYELWIGFSTYKTYKKILDKGAKWPDMNILEDYLFHYFVSTKANIPIKNLCTIGHLNTVTRKIHREKRYAKTKIKWFKRYIKIQRDIIKSVLTSWKDIINMRDLNIRRKLAYLGKGIDIRYLVENIKIYVLPEEVDLPENTLYEFSPYIPRMLLAKVINDKKIKFIKTKAFHFFRDLKFAGKFIENLELVIHNSDFDINKVEIYKIGEIFEKVPYLIHY